MTGESKQSLHHEIHDLHEALGTTENLEESERAELASAIEEIRNALGDSGAEAQPDGLRGRLRAAIARFEDRHPELTKMIGRVADSLSEMGI